MRFCHIAPLALAAALFLPGCGWRSRAPEPAGPQAETTGEAAQQTPAPDLTLQPGQTTGEAGPTAAELKNKLLAALAAKSAAEEKVEQLKERLEQEKAEHAETRSKMLTMSKRLAEYEQEAAKPKEAAPRPPVVSATPEVKATSRKLLALARELYEKDQFAEARKLLEAIIELGYADGYVYFLLARCCSEVGDDDLAIQCYRKACDIYETLDKKPKQYLYALNNQAVLLRKKQKYAEAAVLYERARYIDPKYATAHYNLGVLYDEFLNDKKKALDCYEKYLSLKGDRMADVEERIRDLRQRIRAEQQAKEKKE